MKTDPDKILHLEVKLIDPAAGNRPDGSGLSAKSLKELAASIAQQGLIQPITVRAHPTAKNRYELIAGERRWRAVDLLGEKTIRASVIEATDAEARELRCIENLQREGLHELEEAALFQEMLDVRDAQGKVINTWDSLAKKTGKSTAYVRARVKLLAMPDLAKDAFRSRKLSASVALLICRIPDPKLAHKATCEVLDLAQGREENALDEECEGMSYRQAKQHIQDKYMIRLKDAPFKQDDPTLVPAYTADGADFIKADVAPRCGGGSCDDCPFRTGNMKALFPDVESADVCTNTPCYQKKKAASFKREAEKHKDKGQKLLTPAQSDKVFSPWGAGVRAGYIDLKAEAPGKKGKTFEQVLEKHLPEATPVLVTSGKKKTFVIEVTPEVIEAVKAAGVKVKVEPPPAVTEAEREAKNAERQLNQEAAGVAADEATVLVREKLRADGIGKPLWLMLATIVCDNSAEYFRRHNLPDEKALAAHLGKFTTEHLQVAVFEAVLLNRGTNYDAEFTEDYTDLMTLLKVDLAGLFAAAKSALQVQDETEKLELAGKTPKK